MRTLAVVFVVACSSPPKPPPVLPVAPPIAVPETPTPTALEPPKPTLRLPRNFLPTGYTASLAIDPAATGFDGTVAIAGTVSERSSVIWLHGKNLDIKRAVAKRGDAEVVLAATLHKDDLVELRAASPLDAGPVTLHFSYHGSYDELNTTGAFKQTVRGAPYVYTQFESLYARRVFPCFDEPDNKVPWQLTLEVPKQLVAVSNTPVEREEPVGDAKKRVVFATTKPLSSYLIAFGVGPFDIVDAGASKAGTPIRVITLKDRAPEAAWAAKTAPKILDLLEEFFGMKYPYEKVDLLSIPLTVGFGAMENAGLVTFSETLILLDPKHASRMREYIWVSVASHELAHQWFGNLVTTAFWDDIWLNEGFANWVERKVTARFEASWRDELAELDVRDGALADDSLVSARQIRQPIVTTDDILNAFDGITYNKGASVLNMFESYVGSDVFMKGVRAYIQDHAFGNATSTDFAHAISKAAGKDVDAAFATFLEQAGAPEITAEVACERGQPTKLTLTQHRYLPPGAPTPPQTKPWIVPVCVAFDRNGKRAESCALLEQPTQSFTLDTKACPRWVMPNVDGRGYYHTALTAPQVIALRDEAWSQLRPTERRALVFDASNAAGTGTLPLQLALSFVPKLLAGGDRFSVAAAVQMPLAVDDIVPEDLRGKYEAWVRMTFSPGATKAGFVPKDTDSLDTERARGNLVDAVAHVARDPAFVAEAVKLADRWRDLPQAIRARVLTLAVDASPEIFDRIIKELYTEPDRARRNDMIEALGSVRDPDRQQRALALVLDPKLDVRETLDVMYSAHYEKNRVLVQQYFKLHAKAILDRLPQDETVGSQARLGELFTASCVESRRAEIADYVTKTFAKLAGGARIVQQQLEALDQCIARRKLLEPEIRGWLTGVKVPKPKK